MQFIELKEKLKHFPTFSIPDIRKIEEDFDIRRLSEWTRKGYIKKIRRGHYFFSDAEIREQSLFLAANRIYQPSYVSLETALSYYGLIPETVYVVTSVATLKTRIFSGGFGTFSYKRVKPALFFGYHLERYGSGAFLMADMEKAVLDYLYLHSDMRTDDDFEEWRFNGSEFLERADLEKFERYAEAFGNSRLRARAAALVDFSKRHDL
jgi:predicted transcriptional regulator of viral defense system